MRLENVWTTKSTWVKHRHVATYGGSENAGEFGRSSVTVLATRDGGHSAASAGRGVPAPFR
jgi:hypothetical protein